MSLAERDAACRKVCERAAGRGQSDRGREACKAAGAGDKLHSFYGLLWSKLVADDDEDLSWIDSIESLTALHTR